MKAFYFGSSTRPLFGVYEPPVGADSRRGVVVCNAIGEEYYQTHRACVALARRISRGGVHVLRFDYLGTGDSGGEAEEFVAGDWIDNVGQAIDELKDTTGLRRVMVIGLRTGALIAAKAVEGRRDVDRFVAWDPTLPVAIDPTHLPKSLLAEIGRWVIPGPGEVAVPTLVISTGPEEARDQDPSPEGGEKPEFTECTVSAPLLPSAVEGLGGGGLPAAALDEITSWVTSER